MVTKVYQASFTLTKWNINYVPSLQVHFLVCGFTLTKWNINPILNANARFHGGFTLTKWNINLTQVIDGVPAVLVLH